MADDLTAKTCVPCRGGIPPLTEAQAKDFMRQVPAWTLSPDAHHIHRSFTFPDFKTALDFVDKVGAVAEAEGHHPEIEFGPDDWMVVRPIYAYPVADLAKTDLYLRAAESERPDGLYEE